MIQSRRGFLSESGWSRSVGAAGFWIRIMFSGFQAQMTRTTETDQIRQVIGLLMPVQSEVQKAPDMVDIQRLAEVLGATAAILADFVSLACSTALAVPTRSIVMCVPAAPIRVILAPMLRCDVDRPAGARAGHTGPLPALQVDEAGSADDAGADAAGSGLVEFAPGIPARASAEPPSRIIPVEPKLLSTLEAASRRAFRRGPVAIDLLAADSPYADLPGAFERAKAAVMLALQEPKRLIAPGTIHGSPSILLADFVVTVGRAITTRGCIVLTTRIGERTMATLALRSSPFQRRSVGTSAATVNLGLRLSDPKTPLTGGAGACFDALRSLFLVAIDRAIDAATPRWVREFTAASAAGRDHLTLSPCKIFAKRQANSCLKGGRNACFQ